MIVSIVFLQQHFALHLELNSVGWSNCVSVEQRVILIWPICHCVPSTKLPTAVASSLCCYFRRQV